MLFLLFIFTPIAAQWTSLNASPLNRRNNPVNTSALIYNSPCSYPPVFNNTVAYFGCDTFLVKTIDTRLDWRYNLSAQVACPPAIGPLTILIGDTLGTVWAFNASGAVRWTYKTGQSVHYLVATTDYVYIVGENRFYVLYPNSSLYWAINHTNPALIPAIDSSNIIYANLGDGSLYAYFQNGAMRWRRTLGGTFGNPSIGYNNRIYLSVATSENTSVVYQYSIFGTRTFQLPISGEQADLAIAPDGIIYFVSDNLLYNMTEAGVVNSATDVGNNCSKICISKTDLIVVCADKVFGKNWTVNFGTSGCSIDDSGMIYLNGFSTTALTGFLTSSSSGFLTTALTSSSERFSTTTSTGFSITSSSIGFSSTSSSTSSSTGLTTTSTSPLTSFSTNPLTSSSTTSPTNPLTSSSTTSPTKPLTSSSTTSPTNPLTSSSTTSSSTPIISSPTSPSAGAIAAAVIIPILILIACGIAAAVVFKRKFYAKNIELPDLKISESYLYKNNSTRQEDWLYDENEGRYYYIDNGYKYYYDEAVEAYYYYDENGECQYYPEKA